MVSEENIDLPHKKMTPEEQAIVEAKLKEVAEILYRNTPTAELKTFESIELSVRDHQ